MGVIYESEILFGASLLTPYTDTISYFKIETHIGGPSNLLNYHSIYMKVKIKVIVITATLNYAIESSKMGQKCKV